MLDRLPNAMLPEHLTRILRENSNESKRAFVTVQNIMNEDKFFTILVEKGIKGAKYSDLKKMFHSLGLTTFRNLLSAMYLEFYETGRYSFKPDLSFIQDLLSFEDRFEKYGIPGGNKIYLLALYLKFADAHLQSKGLMGDGEFVNPPSYLEEILDMGKSHQFDVDFLILLVWQLAEIWGEQECKKRIKATKGDFKQILSGLDSSGRKKIAATLLAYCSSIGNDSLFTYQEKV